MIITAPPLRISLGGGGTDLPSYYREFGGIVISAAINKYIYIGINRTFADDYLLKYSELERVRTAEEIKHPIIREALTMHPVGPSLEIVSLADIPAGTGLGSSGTFTVGLLKAIYAFKREHVAPEPWRRKPAASRSTTSRAPSASRTSTSRRSAASPASSSARTAKSESHRFGSAIKPCTTSRNVFCCSSPGTRGRRVDAGGSEGPIGER